MKKLLNNAEIISALTKQNSYSPECIAELSSAIKAAEESKATETVKLFPYDSYNYTVSFKIEFTEGNITNFEGTVGSWEFCFGDWGWEMDLGTGEIEIYH